MKIINICKQPINTIWYDAKTFLFVFDENGNQIADYDFSSGLKLMSDETNMIVFIKDDDLIPGKWKFIGIKLIEKDNKLIEEKIEIYGHKEGEGFSRKYNKKNIWNETELGTFNKITNKHVSIKEREKRIEICRNCPFFINETGFCSINNLLVVQTTKLKYEYCPEEKWGNKEESLQYKNSLLTRPATPDDIIISDKPNLIDPKEQKIFEDELEEYLKGL